MTMTHLFQPGSNITHNQPLPWL